MVFILLPNGKSFALDVNPNATTLHHLKAAIEEHHGTPVSNQRLFLSQSLGENDSDLISNIGIRPFSTLTLHVPFFGGTPTQPAKNGNAAPIPEVMKVEEKKEENVDAAPVLDTISVASNRNGRGKGAVEAKVEDTEVKIEEVDTDSETDEDNKPEGEFKLLKERSLERSKERFMKVIESAGKAMSREKVEDQFDSIPVTEGIWDKFDAQMASENNARIAKWHASSIIKEKEEVEMMLERYSRKKEKKLEKKKKKEQSLKNEEFKN